MTTIIDPSAMTPDDPRWLSWFMQQRRFDRLSRKAQTGASLITDFAAGVYEMGYPGQRRGSYELSDIVKFSRSTGGGRFNSSGVYEWVGKDVPRLTYDPVTLQPLGLLIEEQRTNLLLNSVLAGGTAGIVGAGAVAPTGWSFSGATPNGEITYAATPFGTLGVRFQATAQRPAFGRSVTALANTLYSYHARITALVGSVEIQNAVWAVGFPVDAVRTFWRNGVTVAGNTKVAAGDHVAVIVTMGATAGTFGARFGAGAQTNATCDVTMTMPQVEAGFPSSYIPTGASQVIRAADVPVVNTLAPWFNPLEGTLVVKGELASAAVVNRYLASISTPGTLNNRADIFLNAPGTAQFRVVSSGAIQLAAQVDNPAARAFALTWGVGKPGQGAAGGIPSSSSALIASSPTVTQLRIGCGPLANEFANGIIESITYHPRVIDVQQASA